MDDEFGDGDGDEPGDGDGDSGDTDSEGSTGPLEPADDCGPLEMAWELDRNHERFESVELLPGSVLAYETSYSLDPRGLVHRVEAGASVWSQAIATEPGESSISFSHVAVSAGGTLATASAPVFGEVLVEGFNEAGELAWSWDPGLETSHTRDLLALPGGGYAVFGEHYFDNYMWLWILDDAGDVVRLIGGPDAEGEIYDMHAGGIALDADGNLVVGGWSTQPGFNDVWIAKLSVEGDILWQTNVSDGESGNVAEVMVDVEGSVFAAVDGVGLYKLSSQGALEWLTPVSDWIATATLLAQREPVLVTGGTMWRYSAGGELIETLDTGTSMPVSLEGDVQCRLVLGGGFPSRLVQFEGEVL